MTNKWCNRPLGDLCDILDSKRKPVTKKNRESGEFPYYGATGILDYVEDYIFDEKLVLIGEDGAKWGAGENTAFSANGKYWVNNHAHVIRPHRNIVLDDWVIYYLNSVDLSKFVTGLTVPKLNQAKMREIPVPLPPISEQCRTVAIIDETFELIDAAIVNAEKNLANTRELFESYLRSAFSRRGPGWKERTLKEISAEFGRGKSRHRPRGDIKLLGGEYPLIQTGDVAHGNHMIETYSQSYNDFGLAQSKLWPRGTICIAIVGANVGETAILDFDACFPDSVIGIVVDGQRANNEYVEFLLQTFKATLKQQGKGTARDNINLSTFETQTFPFPDVTEQDRMVASINEFSSETQRLEDIYRQKLVSLAQLKQSILQKAFAGELNTHPNLHLVEALA